MVYPVVALMVEPPLLAGAARTTVAVVPTELADVIEGAA
jgi:hypothetical protein